MKFRPAISKERRSTSVAREEWSTACHIVADQCRCTDYSAQSTVDISERKGVGEREREISQTALSRVIISRCPRLFPYVSCEAENGTGTFSGVPLVSREKLETLN